LVEQLELEGIAAALLREGGEDGDEAPDLACVVTTLLGPNAVGFSHAVPGDGALVPVGDGWLIQVRHRLPGDRHAFVVAHELAEWWMRVREKYDGPDVENCANYIAAAIMAPRRAFQLALRAVGSDFVLLADEFGISESHAALREAEVTGRPRVLVSPALVRTRGDDAFVWPDEGTLRAWARGARPGLRRTQLQDDPRRIVLDVEEEETG
jgi:hypothetical protein